MKCVAHDIDYCTTCNKPTPPPVLLPLKAFTASMEGWTADPNSLDGWPNTVTVAAVEGSQPVQVAPTCGDCVEGRCHWGGAESDESTAAAAAGHDYVSPSGPCGCDRHEASVRARTTGTGTGVEDIDEGYADQFGTRHLVEIDTNYKATRVGQHPVRLTRGDAVALAAHVLAATEDTFHMSRVGRLRAAEAAALLGELDRVEYALQELRDHALEDLLSDTALDTNEEQL
ncbi:hypothetical protein [Actinokineospora sp. HUAS TT18]|uniref:hypothetical protein n=1 Tax=Actinokineospora sp. HUAS TT18 TaxID=3447451 RepID=UPI003F51ECE7